MRTFIKKGIHHRGMKTIFKEKALGYQIISPMAM